MIKWIQEHDVALWWIASSSMVLFFAALVVVPWVILRIPEDYFANRNRPDHWSFARHHPVIRWTLLAVKNLVGVVFVVAGVAMLVLPGQGILTILIGVALLNFPGKFRLERWMVSQGPTLRLINRFRERRGRPALIL